LLINYKCTVSYSGKHFFGFQRQSEVRTVENELLRVIKTIVRDVDKIVASGRTDTGVHALGQVINFKSETAIDLKRLKHSLNSMLPEDISVLDIEIVDDKFDSRRTALSRVYHYLFSPCVLPVYLSDIVSRIYFNPTEDTMNQVAQVFVGEHDFINFRKKGSDEKSTVRHVYDVSLEKCSLTSPYIALDDLYFYKLEIKANSFLYRMVRNCVGAMFQVLQGNYTIDDLIKLRDRQDINFKYSAAPGNGLCLVKVNYD